MDERSLFIAALDIDDPAQRADYLAHACGSDALLRRRLERLLRAHAQAESNFLEEPTAGRPSDLPLGDRLGDATSAAHAPGLPQAAAPGALIGRYKLLEQIGEGGMGVVFMAEQQEPVRRKVALKIIKPGMDSRQIIARFEAERQALALMDHPHIARVLDAGTTGIGDQGLGIRDQGFGIRNHPVGPGSPIPNPPSPIPPGQPYFVMELVKGVPITTYCDERRLTPRQRLELFVPVCHAVQHAHQKGIIHRDLKPSNVLVADYDDQPLPKVIDFGVAKAVEAAGTLTERTLFTGFGHLIGTLEYMSPEQAKLNALDVDTRSDIYSLGVLLYELLTGSPPFDREQLRAASFDESLRIIREREPPTPSTRLLCSATLAAVATQRGTPPAQLGKTLRGDLDWIVMKALEKDRSRRYETAHALTRDLEHFLRDEPVTAGPPTLRYRMGKFARRNQRWLTAAAAFVFILVVATAASISLAVHAYYAQRDASDQRTQAGLERDKALEAKAQASDEAAVAKAVSDFLEKDLLDQASSFNQGTAGMRPSPDIKVRTLLDRAAQRIGGKFKDQPRVEATIRRTIGNAYQHLGLYGEAEEQMAASLAVGRRAYPQDDHQLLNTVNDLALIYYYQGKYDKAEPFYVECLETRRRVFGEEHISTSIAMVNLAVNYARQGRLDEMLPLMEQAVEIRRRVAGDQDNETLILMMNLAPAYQKAGKLDEALTLGKECLALRRRISGDEDPYTLIVMNNLATVYVSQRNFKEAEELLAQVLAVQRRVSGDDHPMTLHVMLNLADAREGVGRFDDARTLHESCISGRRRVLGPDHPDTFIAEGSLATFEGNRGQFEKAESLLRESLANRRRALGADAPVTLLGINDLAAVCAMRGQYAEAEASYNSILETHRRRKMEKSPAALLAMCNLASVYAHQKRIDRAAELYEKTLATGAGVLSPDHVTLQSAQAGLAQLRGEQGDVQSAERLYTHLLDRQRRLYGNNDNQVADTLAGLGKCRLRAAKYTDAGTVLRECLRIREKNMPGDWQAFAAKAMLAETMIGEKHYAEAEPLLLNAYEALKAQEKLIPAPQKDCLLDAAQTLVHLYESSGKPEEAARWRRK